jgi:hypothetical protein
MSAILNIVIIVISIIILYVLIKLITSSSTLASETSGTETKVIQASSLPAGRSTVNFTYSIWFFVNDWNYRYGETKIIYGRLDQNKEPGPLITLSPMENNLVVSMAVYASSQKSASNTGKVNVHKCTVTNIPIQKWVNLTLSVYGRSIDIYLDGKLVKTCVLPGVPKVNASSDMYLTPEGGFSGKTTKFQYWNTSKNPQEVWKIYREGNGSSLLGGIFDKYKLKFSLLENNKEKSSISI